MRDFFRAKTEPTRRGMLSDRQLHFTMFELRNLAVLHVFSLLRVFCELPCRQTIVPEGCTQSSCPACVVSTNLCGRVVALISAVPSEPHSLNSDSLCTGHFSLGKSYVVNSPSRFAQSQTEGRQTAVFGFSRSALIHDWMVAARSPCSQQMCPSESTNTGRSERLTPNSRPILPEASSLVGPRSACLDITFSDSDAL